VVLVLVGYGLWYYHSEHERRLADIVPAVPAELQPLALPPKPAAPPAPKPATTAAPVAAPAQLSGPATPTQAAPAQAAPAQAAPTQTAPSQPSPAQTAAGAKAAAPAATAAATTTTTPAAPAPGKPAPATAASPAAASPAAPPPSGISVVAASTSWIEVRDQKNNTVYKGVLRSGQSWPVPAIPGLLLTTGNAGGTEISANGKTGDPLGKSGSVLHGYELTPKAAKPAPAVTTAPAASK
jgi:cytoskeleton protein RodZ